MPALEIVEFLLPGPPAGLAIEPIYSPPVEPVRIEPVRWAGLRFNPPDSLWTPEPVAPVWYDPPTRHDDLTRSYITAASYEDALAVFSLMAIRECLVDTVLPGDTPPYYNIGASTPYRIVGYSGTMEWMADGRVLCDGVEIDTIAPTMDVSFPAVPGAIAFDLYTDGRGFVERIYVEEDPDWWEDHWDGRDAGPGMLIEELLDDSTLEYIRRREARERR